MPITPSALFCCTVEVDSSLVAPESRLRLEEVVLFDALRRDRDETLAVEQVADASGAAHVAAGSLVELADLCRVLGAGGSDHRRQLCRLHAPRLRRSSALYKGRPDPSAGP